MNITFPALRSSFPTASLATISSALNAYSIVFASPLLPSGLVADLAGRRRVFLLSVPSAARRHTHYSQRDQHEVVVHRLKEHT